MTNYRVNSLIVEPEYLTTQDVAQIQQFEELALRDFAPFGQDRGWHKDAVGVHYKAKIRGGREVRFLAQSVQQMIHTLNGCQIVFAGDYREGPPPKDQIGDRAFDMMAGCDCYWVDVQRREMAFEPSSGLFRTGTLGIALCIESATHTSIYVEKNYQPPSEFQQGNGIATYRIASNDYKDLWEWIKGAIDPNDFGLKNALSFFRDSFDVF